ncbi:MAG: hypothetical protein BGO43_04140 [Gammaproteobacteria bacterium 39-13]|nr:hypothetical protein [Gammaproteobacteria bacterium]OJV94880.1 MAG: hypothetical protein BGO43_04140 [Gammaproteobacteria bacterium 39-13]
MGGVGSGRHLRWDKKDVTEDYHSIDIRIWHRKKLLMPNNSFSWQWTRNGEVTSSIGVKVEVNKVYLNYRKRTHGEDWTDKNYPVYITWTSCNYGNKRPWFFCPAQNCGRRVAILYSGNIYACRHCYRLAYGCQRESFPFRASRQADKIRDKLGWEPGCLNGCGPKPKGMHKKTFKRLFNRHNLLVTQGMAWFGDRFNMLGESYEDWL